MSECERLGHFFALKKKEEEKCAYDHVRTGKCVCVCVCSEQHFKEEKGDLGLPRAQICAIFLFIHQMKFPLVLMENLFSSPLRQQTVYLLFTSFLPQQ